MGIFQVQSALAVRFFVIQAVKSDSSIFNFRKSLHYYPTVCNLSYLNSVVPCFCPEVFTTCLGLASLRISDIYVSSPRPIIPKHILALCHFPVFSR